MKLFLTSSSSSSRPVCCSDSDHLLSVQQAEQLSSHSVYQLLMREQRGGSGASRSARRVRFNAKLKDESRHFSLQNRVSVKKRPD